MKETTYLSNQEVQDFIKKPKGKTEIYNFMKLPLKGEKGVRKIAKDIIMNNRNISDEKASKVKIVRCNEMIQIFNHFGFIV